MLELYHNHMSTCSQKVRVALAEKGLTWTGYHLDLRAGDQQQPDYLKLNPKGVVPTLVHDGMVIRESNVILEYLDDAFPDPPLRPADPYGKAQVRLWNKRFDEGFHDVATATISSAIAFRFQYLAKGEEKCREIIENTPDPIRRERRRDVIFNGTASAQFRTAIGMWVRLLADMEAALSRHAWLAGDAYSIADCAYTPYLTRLDHLHALGLVADRPKVRHWYDRVQSRPSYQTAIRDWVDPGYIALMAEKGDEAWPSVAALVAAA